MNFPLSLLPRYMKYLYPYECEKKNLSSPSELQAAIDGNRREGRRSSYGQFDSQMQGQLQMVSTWSFVLIQTIANLLSPPPMHTVFLETFTRSTEYAANVTIVTSYTWWESGRSSQIDGRSAGWEFTKYCTA